MAEQEKRYAVPLTEKEINALIVQTNQIRISDVHACRVRAVYDGLQELKNVQADIRIEQEMPFNG